MGCGILSNDEPRATSREPRHVFTPGRSHHGQQVGLGDDAPGRRNATQFQVAHECQVVSAHRTPAWMAEYASTAVARGLEVIIEAPAAPPPARNGCVAHDLPVIGVPSKRGAEWTRLAAVDRADAESVPVATVAIGPSGAANAGSSPSRSSRRPVRAPRKVTGVPR